MDCLVFPLNRQGRVRPITPDSARRRIGRIQSVFATISLEAAMACTRSNIRTSGRKAMRSPGRPPAAVREQLVQFWKAIAAGRTSDGAGVDAGVSPAVGVRWFRRAGGMAPSHLSKNSMPLSGRYLSFAEREEIAILYAQEQG